jgi:two-component system cell cycle sensor histidine kinase/response regulator CckA
MKPTPPPGPHDARSSRDAQTTILLAEDERGVRELVRDFLTSQGYRVLAAADGQAALRLASEHAGPIHLLISDIVMPLMAGPELADHLRRQRPDVKILFISGYVGEFAPLSGAFGPDAPLLQKPFSLETLARTVRERLSSV